MKAVEFNIELAKILIEKGAEINASNGYGETPLFKGLFINL